MRLKPTLDGLLQVLYQASSLAAIVNQRYALRTDRLGTISVLFTYPLELIRVRLAFQTRTTDSSTRPTLSRTIRTIYSEGIASPTSHSSSSSLSSPSPSSPSLSTLSKKPSAHIFNTFPIAKFYRGFSVTLVGMVPYAGTSFLVWGYLRSIFIPPAPNTDSQPKYKYKSHPIADLVIGAISGATAQTVSYPFEVIRRRQQVGGLVRPSEWLGFRETCKEVYSRAGWRGFFVGLSIGYLKVVPMTAVSFACWEGGKRILGV